MKQYLVKKGLADPFRGDWYIQEADFKDKEKAVESAALLTLTNVKELTKHWEEFGYEWSVFEKEGSHETKIWEGYKYIQGINNSGEIDNLMLGAIP